MQNNDKLLKVT